MWCVVMKPNHIPFNWDYWIKEYYKELTVRGLTDKTIQGYMCGLQRFHEYNITHDKRITNILGYLECYNDYLYYLRGRGVGVSYLRFNAILIRRFYAFLDFSEIIPKMNIPKRPKRQARALTEQEFMQLLNAEQEFPQHNRGQKLRVIRDKTLIHFLVNTGLRVSELVNLKRTEISFDDHTVKVLNGKGRKDRITYIDDDTIQLLKEYWQQDNMGLLYAFSHTDNRNNSPDNQLTKESVGNIIRTWKKKANLKWNVHPHTLRHTFATRLLRRGLSVAMIQQLLGHETLNTTQQYLHIQSDEIKKAYLQAYNNETTVDEHCENCKYKKAFQILYKDNGGSTP